MTITREHLELAALAAGIFWDSVAQGGIDPRKPMPLGDGCEPDGNGGWWEPHLDDGDAARLAVAVGIITQPQISVPVVNAWMTGWKYQGVREHVRHDGTEPDKLRAWREALVLCAAAVGERMRGER